MTGEITVHRELGALMADPATIEAALQLLQKIERLELVLTINGRTERYPIRFHPDGAVIEATLNV